MPKKIVDLSARSKILRDEPFHLHFWECTPAEFLAFLKDPRKHLKAMGVEIDEDCRIETVIENHDWLAAQTGGLTTSDGTIICNVGGGDIAVARDVYRIVSFAHKDQDIGKYRKKLLHDPDEEERG